MGEVYINQRLFKTTYETGGFSYALGARQAAEDLASTELVSFLPKLQENILNHELNHALADPEVMNGTEKGYFGVKFYGINRRRIHAFTYRPYYRATGNRQKHVLKEIAQAPTKLSIHDRLKIMVINLLSSFKKD